LHPDVNTANKRSRELPMIKPWLFEFLPELGNPSAQPEPHAVAAHFARYLDLWVRDEALGFEGIFFSEHHFGRSYSASPNLTMPRRRRRAFSHGPQLERAGRRGDPGSRTVRPRRHSAPALGRVKNQRRGDGLFHGTSSLTRC
jgi:hypothetical protein